MYNAFNVYRRELAPGTVSLTGDRAQGDDSKHWAYSRPAGKHIISSGPSSVAAEIIVEIYAGTRTTEIEVQRKLDQFEIKLTLCHHM